jgi:cell division protein FtsQ
LVDGRLRLPTTAVKPRHRRRGLPRIGAGVWRLGGYTLFAMAVAGVIAAALRGHLPPPPADLAARFGATATRLAGFAVTEVLIEGRQRADRDQVVAAIGIELGQSLFAFEPEEARARLEAIGWIEHAIVERRLPDTVHVKLTERKPIALWQHDGEVRLIDAKGAVILPEATLAYAKLPLVVGADAAPHAESLLLTLAAEPALAQRVQAAVRVGGRRWNLIMDKGIEVRLPEDEPDVAWGRLAQAERDHRLLARDVRAIDLRLPDRMILRPGTPTHERPHAVANRS